MAVTQKDAPDSTVDRQRPPVSTPATSDSTAVLYTQAFCVSYLDASPQVVTGAGYLIQQTQYEHLATSRGTIISSAGVGQTQDPWLAEALNRIESFASLEKGWDGYRAEAPTAEARWLARTVLEAMSQMGIKPDDVGPSVVGGIGISLARATRSAYVELYNDGQAYVLLDTGNGPPDVRSWSSDADSLTELAKFVGDYVGG